MIRVVCTFILGRAFADLEARHNYKHLYVGHSQLRSFLLVLQPAETLPGLVLKLARVQRSMEPAALGTEFSDPASHPFCRVHELVASRSRQQR